MRRFWVGLAHFGLGLAVGSLALTIVAVVRGETTSWTVLGLVSNPLCIAANLHTIRRLRGQS